MSLFSKTFIMPEASLNPGVSITTRSDHTVAWGISPLMNIGNNWSRLRSPDMINFPKRLVDQKRGQGQRRQFVYRQKTAAQLLNHLTLKRTLSAGLLSMRKLCLQPRRRMRTKLQSRYRDCNKNSVNSLSLTVTMGEDIQPGKPTQNVFVGSFDAIFRDSCLNKHLFRDLNDARKIIIVWRDRYNHVRPHSSLNYMPPAVFAQQAA